MPRNDNPKEIAMLTPTSLEQNNRAQVVLWLAQAAQITLAQERTTEANAIYEEMMRVLAAREEARDE